MRQKELDNLPSEIEDKLLDVLVYLESNRRLDPYEYIGLSREDEANPFLVQFGGKTIAEIEFVMTEKSNGDFDGCEGCKFNYWVEEK